MGIIQLLASVSLSLAIYAFWEKFVPSEKKILTEAEIKANKAAVEELKSKFIEADGVEGTDTHSKIKPHSVERTESGQAINHKKIIISNNKNLK